MKKVNITLSIIVLFSLISCTKQDEPKFNYDIDLLIGKWRVTHIEYNDNMIDITTYPWSTQIEPTYATFYANGTYSGEGYFGDGSGTYTAVENTIKTYVDGSLYLKYEVVSLIGTECELKMYENDETDFIRIKCKKEEVIP